MVDYLSSQPNRAGYQVSTKKGSGPDVVGPVEHHDNHQPGVHEQPSNIAVHRIGLPWLLGALCNKTLPASAEVRNKTKTKYGCAQVPEPRTVYKTGHLFLLVVLRRFDSFPLACPASASAAPRKHPTFTLSTLYPRLVYRCPLPPYPRTKHLPGTFGLKFTLGGVPCLDGFQ